MKITTSPACSQKSGSRQSFNIIGDLEVTVDITHNSFHIPLEQLFEMAARINKKRSFLFVSKVLGKHIPVRPHVSLLAGASLGLLYQQFRNEPLPVPLESLLQAFAAPEAADEVYAAMKRSKMTVKEKTLFIGFAETATALGHSMFDMFEGEAAFLHTTRESIAYMTSCIDFEEEHSHATSHRCYAADPEIFREAETIILVDDEMTTGKTSLNIIHDLHAKYGKKRYVVASLLDWRSKEDVKRYADVERELGISIECLSLLAGEISVKGQPIDQAAAAAEQTSPPDEPAYHFVHVNESFAQLPSSMEEAAYLNNTGRFGLTSEESRLLDQEVEIAAAQLIRYRTGGRTLCMGTGEFMYIPMRIAAELGENVWYQSTTRSPIHPVASPHYAVHSAYRFTSPEHPDVTNFMYNITPGSYDDMFLFMEREASEQQLIELKQALAQLRIPNIYIVYFCRTGRSV